jgi:hypothetical protein
MLISPYYSPLSLNMNIHAYHCIQVLTPLVVKELLEDNTHQATLILTLLPLSKASTDCITFYRISLCNFYLCNGCAYTYSNSLET